MNGETKIPGYEIPTPNEIGSRKPFGSNLQLIVYTALGRATLFHFAHCLTNSARAGSDMAIQQPMRSPAGGLRGLRYGGAEHSFPLGLMASQPDVAPYENKNPCNLNRLHNIVWPLLALTKPQDLED